MISTVFKFVSFFVRDPVTWSLLQKLQTVVGSFLT